MKKLITFACLFMVIAIVAGCGTQNEDLSKGKEWVKSDKRGRIPKAIDSFEKAIVKEPENAEAQYLLGYYDENATIELRAKHIVKAYDNDERKYLKILIEETLRDRDENVRKSAAKALQEIYKKDPERCMERLVKTLKSKDSRDRDDAALVLSQLDNHREVVDVLIQKDILKHRRMNTRFDAVRALGNIGDPRAIDPLMERITALKAKGEKDEKPEVRRAAVVALRQIARRNINITGTSLDISVETADEGVRVVSDLPGTLASKVTLKKGEIISRVINNRKITSLEDYNNFLAEALENGDTVTFGIPKTVEVIASKVEELGVMKGDIEALPEGGIVIDRFEIESKVRKMGIEKGETISHINDQKVNSVADYERIVKEAIESGENIRFTVANMDKYRLLTVQAPSDGGDLGMTVKAMPDEAEGVIVTSVQPRSAALEAGVREGHVFSYIVNEGRVDRILFSMGYELLEELDNEIFSEQLRQKFTDKNIPLPQNVTIRVKEEGYMWGVHDEGGIILYVIKRENHRLNTYVDSVDEYRQLLKEGLADGEVTLSVINKSAVSKLIDVLRNKGLVVRFDAAQALGEVQDAAAVESLIKMLGEQANPIEISLK